MFIASNQRDEKARIDVEIDEVDALWPVCMNFAIEGHSTKVFMNREEALDLYSQLEKAIHQTAVAK